jgi:hypothetical protein
MRFIVCNLISLSELDGRELDLHSIGAMMPELRSGNQLKSWPYQTMPRFVKTNQPYRRLIFSVPKRVVYILRDPRDIMVSYYHMQKAQLAQPFAGNFTRFIRHPRWGLRACVQHYLSWLPHTTHFIRYEAMKEDGVAEFQRMLAALRVPVDNELLQLAVDNSSFDKMRAVEDEKGTPFAERSSSQYRHIRKGKTKQWPDYFSEEDIGFYQQVCREHGFDLYP